MMCQRDYRTLSSLAFTVILQGTWEVLLVATTEGLVDGGLAGLFWSYVWTWLGFSTVMASLAEMASMSVIVAAEQSSCPRIPLATPAFLLTRPGIQGTNCWRSIVST